MSRIKNIVPTGRITSRIFQLGLVVMVIGICVTATSLGSGGHAKVSAAPAGVDCHTDLIREGGGSWSAGDTSHDLWSYGLYAAPQGGWGGDVFSHAGQTVESQSCSPQNPANDNFDIDAGVLASADGRFPIGLHLGLQANDAINQGAGAQISDGRWAAPSANGIPASDRPPVFQYNWQAPSAYVDDSGAFQIRRGGATQLIWCQALVDTTWNAATAGCGPDISSGFYSNNIPLGSGTPAGAGTLMNRNDCKLNNPAVPNPGGYDPGAGCADPASFSWIRTPGQTEDLTASIVGRDPAHGRLNNFNANLASTNLINGGWGAITWLQADYPNVDLVTAPSCSKAGFSYNAINPLYPAYPAERPQVTFTFRGGNSRTISGPTGVVKVPPSMYDGGDTIVTATTRLDGKLIVKTTTVKCVAPPKCGTTTFTPFSSNNLYEPNKAITANQTITNPQAGYTTLFRLSNKSNSLVKTSGATDTSSGTASWGFQVPIAGYFQVEATVSYNYYGAPGTLRCGTNAGIDDTRAAVMSCPPDSKPACVSGVTITNLPYVKVYGGDVNAGNGFKTASGTCASRTSDIISWNTNAAPYGGSGTQFAAFANGTIQGFASAQGTGTAIGQSFANTDPAKTNPVNGLYGGGFNGVSCANDFYTQRGDPATSDYSTLSFTSPNTAALPNSGTYYKSGDLTITGGIITGSLVIYVDGNVNITGDITYNESAIGVNSSPFLEIIAKGASSIGKGNIYINSNVKTLDGVYIAEPSANNTGGTFYSCTNGFNTVSKLDANYYSTCNNQLVINGGIVADTIKFMRTNGSVSDGNNDYQGVGGTRGNCDVSSSATNTGGSCAAEVVNYSPLIWIGASRVGNFGSAYDAIAGLPPVL